MKILFDTNVILDVILNRQPFAPSAIVLVAAVEEKQIQGFLCATTLTTIDYLVSKALGTTQARTTLKKLLQLFEIAAVNYPVIQTAIESSIKDFEDAVLYEAAKRAGVVGIVTRNKVDFTHVDLPIYLPDELATIVGLRRIHAEAASYKAR